MNILRDFFRKIDQGDSRVFILGIVLCIVGMLLFSAKITIKISGSGERSPGKSPSGSSSGGGFSIVRSSPSSSNNRDNGPGGGGSLVFSAQTESEWKSATEAIVREKATIPDSANLTPFGRSLFEAEMNDDLRLTNDLLDSGKFKEAIPILQKLLAEGSDNAFLKAMACSNLCAAYEALGMHAELEKEFPKLVQFLESMPEGNGFSAHLSKGLKFLAEQKGLLEKVAGSAESREVISQIFNKAGLTLSISHENFGKESTAFFDRHIPGLNGFKQ